MHDETICAPATAPVNSAIAIIRISGPNAYGAASSVFSHPQRLKPRQAAYGTIQDDNKDLDDVLMIFYEGPKSFTGEDMVEIFCHGNQIIIHNILNLLHRKGVALAEPGEFSKRAFLNGKVDLTEAEAIHQVITAKSAWEVETALKQMHGALKEVIHAIRNDVIELKADIEAGIDFIEEDIEFVSNSGAIAIAERARERIESLLRRCRAGEQASQGFDVTIAGRPNVGKSSLLNLMLNRDRAIVSNIPGTTRDLIKESIQIAGLQVNLIDTAGIDKPGDEIERIGIELSHRNIESASIVIMVIDGAAGITPRDRKLLSETETKERILCINKSDLISDEALDSLRKELGEKTLAISAKEGKGLKELEETLAEILRNDFVEINDSFIADMRVISLLELSLGRIDASLKLLHQQEPPEIVAFELESLLESLGEITGEITPDDVLGSIFSRFCIGK